MLSWITLREGVVAQMRIDRLLTECGLCSRKEAALAARRGDITVNGDREANVSRHIDPATDRIAFCGREVLYRRYTYVMLNKPAGYVSATEDRSLPYVTELLSPELQKRGLFPVGRLDRDTLGMMILTNNGSLAHRLLSPRRHVEKEYRFICSLPLPADAESRFASGLALSDGFVCKSALLRPDPDRMGGIVVLTEGKYHQIKRMMEAIGTRVTSLERVSFAGLALDPALARGEWRPLTEREEALLLAAAQDPAQGGAPPQGETP